ncbi:PH domain-containing protein [Streptomyces lonarensis]|uniref:PH domain-containing protein n=2 Tax=Streptomyces lonarensis TaxID=700599 RepID=A0A7X6I0U7_9ACTN|nr:PH domain-containing protein [Streptomyces lonarensis]NJQ08143.1 PH domain-containing protein [Streptomyces lonarensis]
MTAEHTTPAVPPPAAPRAEPPTAPPADAGRAAPVADVPGPPEGAPLVEETPPPDDGTPWQRLDGRMIGADALRVLLSMAPAAVALLVVGVEPDAGVVWPLAVLAAWGAFKAVRNTVRWATTRYRLTDDYLERRTGLLVRSHRSIRRERVRSVDGEARLLQRLFGLRRVKVGAGQMNTAMESALVLDAVSRAAARDLHARLLGEDRTTGPAPAATSAAASAAAATDTAATDTARTPVGGEDPAAAPPAGRATRQLSRLRPWWVVYNCFSVWGLLMAAGLAWGGWVTLGMFGFNAFAWVRGLADWGAIGVPGTVAAAVLAAWALGVVGLAVNFATTYAHFRLERTTGEHGDVLRTTQGLFRTQEINRDENRLRGATLSEPLLWRWLRVADPAIITTGLSVWSSASAILPRCPREHARSVLTEVLRAGEDNPLRAPLRRHPAGALRRRLVWAVAVAATATAVLAWLAATTALPHAVWWVTGPVLLTAGCGLAVAGYRSLGHSFAGPWVVVRSGAVNRATSVLRTGAVSGVRVRQSLFQRRLGLATVTVSTAAGYGAYEAVDLAAPRAAEFADRALPGGVAAFLEAEPPAR